MKANHNPDQIENDFVRAEDALRDAIAFLDIALQRVTRLYPQQDLEYREYIRNVHTGATDLFVALSHEYGYRFNKHPNDLMRMVRREIPLPGQMEEKVTS